MTRKGTINWLSRNIAIEMIYVSLKYIFCEEDWQVIFSSEKHLFRICCTFEYWCYKKILPSLAKVNVILFSSSNFLLGRLPLHGKQETNSKKDFYELVFWGGLEAAMVDLTFFFRSRNQLCVSWNTWVHVSVRKFVYSVEISVVRNFCCVLFCSFSSIFSGGN